MKTEQQQVNMTLFTPLQFGPFKLFHRVVMGPMLRCRSYGSIPQRNAALYYGQRATPGGLIITESTSISPTADGYLSTPGIWTEKQVEAWRPIVKAVHGKGGIFICQLSHVGRRSHTCFDGVELHAANGYLLEQFLKDGVNDRTDQYGGGIANRARFVLEVVEAVANAIGKDRVGMKLSPYADSWDSCDSDPTSLGVYMAERLSDIGVLYVSFQEARVQSDGLDHRRTESLWPFRKAFKGLFLAGGGYTRQEGMEATESGKVDAVIYAGLFLANPDLPRRFALSAAPPFNDLNFRTLFSADPVVGYTDYPFLDEGDLKLLGAKQREDNHNEGPLISDNSATHIDWATAVKSQPSSLMDRDHYEPSSFRG